MKPNWNCIKCHSTGQAKKKKKQKHKQKLHACIHSRNR